MLSLYLILFAITGLGILALVLIAYGQYKAATPRTMTPELDDEVEAEEAMPAVIESKEVKEVADPTLASLGFSALDNVSEEPERAQEVVTIAPEQYPERKTTMPAKNIIVFYLFASNGRSFVGYELLQALLAVDLRFGEKRIFHRYEHADGSGQVLFSVASAVEPGVFDIADMGGFSCPGLCLFMSPDNFSNPEAIFELMLETAQQLAEDLDGKLCNERREPLSKEQIAEYSEQFV